jgi:hypothetical protein
MIKKIVFFSLILFGIKAALLGQANPNTQLQITWQACYGTPYNDGGIICPAYGGGYIMLSSTQNNDSDTLPGGFGKDDIILRRFNSNFQMIWQKNIGGSEDDWNGSIVADGLGYYYCSATTYSNDGDVQSFNHGGGDIWIFKIDSIGNIVWERCFGGSRYDGSTMISMLSDSNIIVTSLTYSWDGDLPIHYGYSDTWIFKLSTNGEILESKVFGNSQDHNQTFNLIETRDGGFFTVSTGVEGEMVSAPGHHGGFDVWALKLDKHLNIEWQKVYGGSCDDRGFIPIYETNEGYLFFAFTTSNDGDVTGYMGTPCEDAEANAWIVRIDTIGSIIWQKSLGIGLVREVFPTKTGGYVLFGIKRMTGCSMYVNEDIFVKEIDSLGNILWENTYGSFANDGLGKVFERGPYNWLISGAGQFYPDMPSCDMQCGSIGSQDIWLFELKDCSLLYQPATPARPVGPPSVCTSLSPQSTYYVHPAALAQTYEWHIHPSEAGTAEQQDTTMTLSWAPGFEGVVALRARAVNECGPSEWSVFHWADVHTCIGMTELAQGSIRLWPNPADDMLNIAFPAATHLPVHLTLSDLTGRVLLSQEISQPHSVISLSSLPRGAYFCRLASREINVTAKIIKGL